MICRGYSRRISFLSRRDVWLIGAILSLAAGLGLLGLLGRLYWWSGDNNTTLQQSDAKSGNADRATLYERSDQNEVTGNRKRRESRDLSSTVTNEDMGTEAQQGTDNRATGSGSGLGSPNLPNPTESDSDQADNGTEDGGPYQEILTLEESQLADQISEQISGDPTLSREERLELMRMLATITQRVSGGPTHVEITGENIASTNNIAVVTEDNIAQYTDP